ncbi:MAG: helix-turn-helix domain-containing protein [Gemmatimonadales bacterium]|nr:helix-turn-helix domain-containing protein [Gemmatimonadales bacterium]
MEGRESSGPARNVGRIDRLIHEPARLMVMAHLYVLERADFVFLMRQTGMTQGNLSSHLSKLEEAGYIEVKKTFKGKRPHTMLQLTEAGRAAFRDYRQSMELVLGEPGQEARADGATT